MEKLFLTDLIDEQSLLSFSEFFYQNNDLYIFFYDYEKYYSYKKHDKFFTFKEDRDCPEFRNINIIPISVDSRKIGEFSVFNHDFTVVSSKDLKIVMFSFNLLKEQMTRNLHMLNDLRERNEIMLKYNERNQLFSNIFEKSPLGISIVDLDGKILDLNKSYALILESEKEVIINKYIWDFSVKEDYVKIRDIMDNLISEKYQSIKMIKHTLIKNNKVKTSNIYFTLIKDSRNNPLYFLGIHEDLTNIQNCYQKVCTLGKNIKGIKKAAYDGIVICRNEKISDVNQNFLDFTMYRRNDIRGKSIYRIFPEDLIYLIRKDKIVKNLKTTITRSDGNVLKVNINVDHRDEMIVIAVKDLASVSIIENLQINMEMNYRQIIERSPVPALLFENSDDGLRLIDMNKSTFKKFEIGFNRNIGRKFEEIFSEITPDILENLKNITLSNGTYHNRDIRFSHMGNLKIFEIFVFYIGNNKIAVQCHDMTSDILLQRKISDMNRELEEKVKERTTDLMKTNEELTAYSLTVSHDLKNPLTILAGYIDLIREDFNAGNRLEFEENIHYIERSVERMISLIDNILEFSKLEGRKISVLEEIDLSKIVRDIIFEKIRYEKINIKLSIQDSIRVNGDINLVRIIFNNLITNSVKYRKEDEILLLRLYVTTEENRMKISLEDNGIGFDNKFAEEIFKPLKRLVSNDRIQGTGVGLATVKRLCDKLGWDIKAEGEEGKGATFSLYI